MSLFRTNNHHRGQRDQQGSERSRGLLSRALLTPLMCLRGWWTPDWWHTMGPIHPLSPICRGHKGPICRSIVSGADSSCGAHAVMSRSAGPEHTSRHKQTRTYERPIVRGCSDRRLTSHQHQSDRTRSPYAQRKQNNFSRKQSPASREGHYNSLNLKLNFISKALSKITMATKVLYIKITTQIQTVYSTLLKANENKCVFAFRKWS